MQLNKSSSAPDISWSGPLFRRVVIEEQFLPTATNQTFNRVLTPSLISRHCSYGQLTYSEFADRSTGANCIYNSTIGTPMKDSRNADMHGSPMEIDQIHVNESGIDKDLQTKKIRHTQPLRILDNIDLTFRGSTPILRRVKKWKPRKNSSNPNFRSKLGTPEGSEESPRKKQSYFKMICGLLLAIIGITLYDKLYYTRIVDVESIKSDLQTSVIGQNSAIQQLGASMEKFSTKFASKTNQRSLLALIGSTGVGKTLCVNIIKRQFKPKQIREIDVDMNSYHEDITKNVPYLVIMDDLTFQKIPAVMNILQALPDDKWILAITVFNIQETDDCTTFKTNQSLLDLIPKELDQLDFDFDMIHFNSFTLKDANILLEGFETVYRGIVAIVREWKTLIMQHNFEIFGFKGLVEKMIAHSN